MEDETKTPVPQAQTEPAQPPQAGAPQPEQEAPAPAPRPTAREALYSHFDKVPLKVVDAVIVVSIIAFFAVIAVGVTQAHGLL